MKTLCLAALDDLRAVFERLDDKSVGKMVDEIVAARHIVLYGVGREGLQIKGLAMRLHHLGLAVAMVGDMTTPPIGTGDLLIVSAGPGYFSTVAALMSVAAKAGARTLMVTAQPASELAHTADTIVTIPAQTMANDRGTKISVLPMGSLFEGAEFITFEAVVTAVRDRLGLSPEAMRARHTNLE